MNKEFILNPLAGGEIDPAISDFLVANRYATEYLEDITLLQIQNLKVWGMLPPGVKSHEMSVDVKNRTVVYVLHLKSGKKLGETVVEQYLRPLSKACQLLLGETWDITWKRAKKTIYHQPRRKAFMPLEEPEAR